MYECLLSKPIYSSQIDSPMSVYVVTNTYSITQLVFTSFILLPLLNLMCCFLYVLLYTDTWKVLYIIIDLC